MPALALIVVELLTGRSALDGTDTLQLFVAATNPGRRPTPLAFGTKVAPAVEDVLVRALAVEPAARYASVGELWLALARAVEQGEAASAHTVPSSALQRAGITPTTEYVPPAQIPPSPSGDSRPARGRAASALAVAALLLVSVIGGTYALQRRETHDEPSSAIVFPASAPAAPDAPLELTPDHRAPTAAPAPSERFATTPCGSIRDGESGLEWYVGPDRDTTFDEASFWAAGLGACDASWRLPETGELAALFDPRWTAGRGFERGGKRYPAKIHVAFDGIGGGSWIWTARPKDEELAWAHNMHTNARVALRKDTTGTGDARHAVRAFAVRGRARAQPSEPPRRDAPGGLAPEDETFVDSRGGAGWGDRCWLHIKAENLSAARAACDRAMAMSPASPQPRASILYNLGIIEQRRGNVDAARRYYTESLAIRPHPDVEAALASLDTFGRPLTADEGEDE